MLGMKFTFGKAKQWQSGSPHKGALESPWVMWIGTVCWRPNRSFWRILGYMEWNMSSCHQCSNNIFGGFENWSHLTNTCFMEDQVMTFNFIGLKAYGRLANFWRIFLPWTKDIWIWWLTLNQSKSTLIPSD